MKPANVLFIALSTVLLQIPVASYAAEKPAVPTPSIPAPNKKLSPPKSVTNPNPGLRNSIRTNPGGKQLKYYRQNNTALTRLQRKLQLFENKLIELDRFAGGLSSRIQRCMSASYTPQQRTAAGCGPGTSLGQCSYMLLVNCTGGAAAMNRNYRTYMNKLRATDSAADDVMTRYANMKSDIATALTAVGPVSNNNSSSLPQIRWTPRPPPPKPTIGEIKEIR